MPIRNSFRAFFIAILPLGILQAALFANGIAGALGAVPMPDNAFGIFATRFGLDVALLIGGHLALRNQRIATRAAYGLMGGAAVALAYTIAQLHGVQLVQPAPGTLVTSAVVPVLVGMISGFLYAQFAGHDFVHEAALAMPAAPQVTPELAAPIPAIAPARRPSLPPASYDGPVLVRTSIAATAIAAALPAIIVTVLTLMVLLPGFASIAGFNKSMIAAELALPAQIFFVTLFVMFVPAAIVVAATHALARSFGLTQGRHYALLGAATNCVAALLLIAMVHAAFLFPVAAIIGALMGAVYRRFAGLEPSPLPESVLVEDPRTLVPADHPARHTHAVIMNG
jgi:hypothetical protein